MSDREIKIKLTIDGKEAVASIQTTDEEMKRLKKTFLESNPILNQFEKELTELAGDNKFVVSAIKDFIAYNKLSESQIQKVRENLISQSKALDITSSEYKQTKQAVENLDSAEKQLLNTGQKFNGNTETSTGLLNKWSTAMIGINQGLEIVRKGWDLLNRTIDIYEQRQKAILEISTTIKSMGKEAEYSTDKLVSMADSLEEFNKYAFDANEIMSGESFLIGFENMNKDILPNTTQLMIDLAKRMGTDLPNAAMTLGRALEAPEEGFRLFKSFGIIFTSAEKEIIKNAVETGESLKAKGIYLDALAMKVGGFTRNTSTYLDSAKNKWKDFFQTIQEYAGEALLSNIDFFFTSIEERIRRFKEFPEQLAAEIDKGAIQMAANKAVNFIKSKTDEEIQALLNNTKSKIIAFSKMEPTEDNKNDFQQQLAILKVYEKEIEARKILTDKKNKADSEKRVQDFQNAETRLMESLKFENENYYDWKVNQLKEESKKYSDLLNNKLIADKWYYHELEKLDKEKLQAYKPTIEQANNLNNIKPIHLDIKGMPGIGVFDAENKKKAEDNIQYIRDLELAAIDDIYKAKRVEIDGWYEMQKEKFY
ncbi:MAG: hypothetical protein C4539_08935 [Ignavibacteriales bacterium]|nr:MAG: hypothetical protein C4539_08935 [Ignavibacteriales bacterium]